MKKIWVKERCQEESLKYTTRNDFCKKSPSAYSASLKNNWLNDICEHMQELRKPKEYWSKKRCQEEALKYKSRSDFNKKSLSAYCKSWENNWLDEICSHMDYNGNKYIRCIYVYEFDDKSAYIGLTYNILSRKNQHNKRGPVYEHSKKHNFIFKILTDFIDVNIAKIKEFDFCKIYKEKGWKLLNSAKPGACGGGTRKWTKEKCEEEAKKFNNIKDYSSNSLSYRAAIRNKWIDDITKHMNRNNKKNYNYWTYEKCKEIISTLEKVIDLYKEYPGAYNACKKNNWDDLLIDLKRSSSKPKGYWTKEKCKEEASKYKSKKEFRENNISAYTLSNRLKIMDEICKHMI